MIPTDILIAYLASVLLVVISPGLDNILAISRGLRQGRFAGVLSSIGAGLGVMCHTVAAAMGLALLLQTSPVAFGVVKVVGAACLIWLGYKAISTRNLVSFAPAQHQSLMRVFMTGLLSNVLNPKPGLFVVAFIPQFTSPLRGSVPEQMLVFGAIFAVLTAVIFFAAGLLSGAVVALAIPPPSGGGWHQYRRRADALAGGVFYFGFGASEWGLRQECSGSSPSQKHPIGGCPSSYRGAKIVKSLAHSNTYKVRGLPVFLYLYKRT